MGPASKNGLDVPRLSSKSEMTTRLYDSTVQYFSEIIKYDSDIPKQAKESKKVIYDLKEVKHPARSLVDTKVKITVVEQDCLHEAKHILDTCHSTPLVLNMASYFQPGGGWRKGSMAQEESLFYRSTYDLHLNGKHGYCESFYPMKLNEMIWSPGVFIFKDENFKVLDWKDCFKVDFLALAALRKPKLTHDKQFFDRDREITRAKIHALFEFAETMKYKHLILSALGCGAYNNPPKEVAQLFKEELNLHRNSFVTITFAILSIKDQKNFKLFKQILLS